MFRSLWRATGLIAAANAAALGVQFVTTVLTAREFGTSAQMDAYTLAVSVPESLQYVLMLATLSVLFTPLWMDVRVRLGDTEAWSMAVSLLLVLTLGVLVLLPILFFAMPTLMLWLAPGLSAPTRALAVTLSDIILPGLFYYATAGILLGLCYAHRDFNIAALNTVLFAVLNLGAFFASVQLLHAGVRGLMVGRLVVLALLQIFLLWGALRHRRGISARIRLWHPQVGMVMTYLPPYMFGALSGQLALLVNRSFVSTLGEGSVAAWGYGQRLADIPLAVLGAAFGATFLPDFAAHVAAHETAAARASWTRTLVRVCIALAPATLLFVFAGAPLIALLFQRGSFDAQSTQVSALVLAGLALGLPARGVGGLIVRGMPAFKTRVLPLLLSALATGTNIVLDIVLIGALGLFGIAFAASLGDTLFAVVGGIVFLRWLRSPPPAKAPTTARGAS